jgi:CHASE3 domain sensor protein
MNQRLVSGFWVTVLILVVMGWFSYTSIREFSETSKVVARSNAYLSVLERLLTNVVSAESEVRGFVIMGNEEYLGLYNGSVREVEIGLERLITTPAPKTSDETEDKLAQLIRARMERLRMSIDARRRGGLDAGVVGQYLSNGAERVERCGDAVGANFGSIHVDYFGGEPSRGDF